MVCMIYLFAWLALNALTFQYPASVVDIVELLERRVRENSWIVNICLFLNVYKYILFLLSRQLED